MSTPTKLRGGKPSELTRFKELWRDTLNESQKDFWRSRFVSKDKQSEIREEIRVKLKIELLYDKQLNQFRKWDEQQLANEEEAEWAAHEEQELEKQGLSGEALRTELLDRMKRRALARGDSALGLAAIDRDIRIEALAFEQEKFKEGLRSKLESAFNELAVAVKGNAVAEEHIRKARELIAPEK